MATFQKGNTASKGKGRPRGTANPVNQLQKKLNETSKKAVDKCLKNGHQTAYEFLSTMIQEDGGVPVACVNVDAPNIPESRQFAASIDQKLRAAQKLVDFQQRKMPTGIEMDDETATLIGAASTLAAHKLRDFLDSDDDDDTK